VVDLCGQRLDLRVRLFPFLLQRGDHTLRLRDVRVHLWPAVPPQGRVEAGLGRAPLTERQNVPAVRHTAILTRPCPVTLSYHPERDRTRRSSAFAPRRERQTVAATPSPRPWRLPASPVSRRRPSRPARTRPDPGT